MKIIRLSAALVVLLLSAAGWMCRAWGQTQGQPQTAAGVWRTVDDKTGQPKGEVRIFEQSGRWFGQITRIYDTKDAQSRCDECQGDRKGKPMMELVIVRNLTLANGDYSGGDILDPDTGNV